MSELRLDLQAIEKIAVFERYTKVPASDYLETGTAVYFLVPRGAIRRLQKNNGLERLGRKLGKPIRLVEHRDDPEAFLRSLFWSYGVEEASVQEGPDGLEGRVRVSPLRKGRAIGKGGENLNALRELALRHGGIVKVTLD